MNATNVLVIVGMACEARIAGGPRVLVFSRLSEGGVGNALARLTVPNFSGLVSFGLAGGLDPELRPGQCVVASAIVDGTVAYRTDFALSRKLLDLLPESEFGPILGVDSPVIDPGAKNALHLRSAAAAIDMESHHVARFAHARGVPFAALRVVIDPAERAVPPAALKGLRPEGSSDPANLVRELLRRPSDAPGIARLAWDAAIALNALRAMRQRLGDGLGLGGLEG